MCVPAHEKMPHSGNTAGEAIETRNTHASPGTRLVAQTALIEVCMAPIRHFGIVCHTGQAQVPRSRHTNDWTMRVWIGLVVAKRWRWASEGMRDRGFGEAMDEVLSIAIGGEVVGKFVFA